jgi:hypothetical protein
MSTTTVGSRDVIKAARAQIPVLEAELSRIATASTEHRQQIAALDKETSKAWEYLATVLVPDLEPPHLDWASRLLSLRPLSARAIEAGIEEDRDELEAELAKIRSHDDYVRREGLLNGVSIQLEEVNEAIAPLRSALDAYEVQLLWEHLLESGYGTDAYTGKWWTMSYYRDWKHGDLAVAKLGEQFSVSTFGELAARYRQERDAHEQLLATKASLEARKDAVDRLTARHDQAANRLARLQPRHLASARGKVIEHLKALKLPEIAKMVGSYEPAVIAVKRLAGLEAKRRYLDETFDEWVARPGAALKKALTKAQRDIVKLARPKNSQRRFDKSAFDRRFADRSDGWNKRWSRYRQSNSRIVAFDAYDRFDFDDGTPWWSVMTGDTVKARFIPEVATYYQRRADSAPRRDRTDGEELAFAALAGQGAAGDEPFDDMS